MAFEPRASPSKEAPEVNNEELSPDSPKANGENHKEPTKAIEKTWLGYFETKSQKWWCDCDPPQRAKCVTVTRNGANKGRKFWVCLKSKKEQCPFWVWVDEESEAKGWLAKHADPLPIQSTPPKARDSGYQVPNDVTPWSLSKRKPVSREVSDEKGLSDGDGFIMIDDDVGMESPSRKAAKRHVGATPGASSSNQELQRVLELPTPETNVMSSKAHGKLPAFNPSSQLPQRLKEIVEQSEDDLTERVLGLIAEDGVRLKASTTLQIRHEIELAGDLASVKQRKNDETLAQALKRIDELEEIHSQDASRINKLEETISHLTGFSESQASDVYEL